MSDKDYERLIEDLARDTGVDSASVEAVVKNLGLDKVLPLAREMVGPQLANVSAKNLEIGIRIHKNLISK